MAGGRQALVHFGLGHLRYSIPTLYGCDRLILAEVAFGEPLESCTIITTDANDLMRSLHHRMPVILDAKEYDRWLDPAAQDPTNLAPLLVPYRGGDLTAYAVSTRVNNPGNDDARCVEPVAVRGPTRDG